MRRIGVWIDKKKAHIVNIYNGKVSFNTLLSNVENFHIHGGSGTRVKGGPQDVVQDSRYLERENNQLKKYFKNITSEIRDAEDIVIFGPAETGEKLYKELSEKYSDVKVKVKQVVKTDSMTKKQVKAWVKDFFNLPRTSKSYLA